MATTRLPMLMSQSSGRPQVLNFVLDLAFTDATMQQVLIKKQL